MRSEIRRADGAELRNEFDWEVLAHWLAQTVDAASNVSIRRVDASCEAGSSADTLFVEAEWDAGGANEVHALVLRRQVLGHDILPKPELVFQARIMQNLSERIDVAFQVPTLVGLELSGVVLGAPFLVMERLPGRIVPQNPNYNQAGWLCDLAPADRCRVWSNGLQALAAVHRTDWTQDLVFTARGEQPTLEGYVDWIARWMDWAVAGRDYPVGAAAIEFLRASRPSDAQAQLLWGDATPANILFDANGNVSGLIDWEMAAIAPGEVDLAWWLMFDELFAGGFGAERLAGLPDQEQTIAIYSEAAGRSIGDLQYYHILVRLRMAMVALRLSDRAVAKGEMPAESDAWLRNPFTAALSTMLEIDPVTVGNDFFALAAQR